VAPRACWRSAIAGEPRSSPSRTRRASATRSASAAGRIPESLLQPVRDPLGDLALRTRATTRRSPPDFARATGSRARAKRLMRCRRGGCRRRVPAGRHAARVDRRRVLRMLRAGRSPSCGTKSSRSTSGPRPVRDHLAGDREAPARRGRAARRDRAAAGRAAAASILETEILPARIDVYDPADLDAVTAAGEVVWVGVEPLGERDGRVALYLADHLPRLCPR
jgi:ATP-dependent Lhr-like helicase